MKKFFLLSCLVVSMPSVFGMDKFLKSFNKNFFKSKESEFGSQEKNVTISDHEKTEKSKSINSSNKDKFSSKHTPLYTAGSW